ncbi:MAG: nuclear transport factor 2 family protein [Bacteroidota bacterium]
MNRILLQVVFIFSGFMAFSQPDTEVFLFDFEFSKDSLKLSNIEVISEDNPGYDNQPSFLNDSIILFVSTRNDQTDIKSYNLNSSKGKWITDTEASEYSPIKIPGQDAFAAVKLEKDGEQRLFKYSFTDPKLNVMIIDDIVIGYHVWLNGNIVISSILKDENLTLTVSDFRFKKHKDLVEHVGRSLSIIPKTDPPNFSFVDKNTNPWQLMSFNLDKLEAEPLFEMMPNVEDLVWLDDDYAFCGKGSKVFVRKNRNRGKWEEVANLAGFGINHITRMAISPNKKKMAIVGQYIADYDPTTPDDIVQQQLEAYNYQDIDMFLETYTDDIKLYNYPNELFAEGKEQLREIYSKLFEKTPDLYAELENRTIIGNKVIDKEKVLMNGKTIFAVAIYEVENGLIKKVTFLR